MYVVAALMSTSHADCSMWCKPHSQIYWEACKATVFGEKWWFENLRISKPPFGILCNQLRPYIEKTVTRYRFPVAVYK